MKYRVDNERLWWVFDTESIEQAHREAIIAASKWFRIFREWKKENGYFPPVTTSRIISQILLGKFRMIRLDEVKK